LLWNLSEEPAEEIVEGEKVARDSSSCLVGRSGAVAAFRVPEEDHFRPEERRKPAPANRSAKRKNARNFFALKKYSLSFKP
jgi:hypothetical protein